MFKIKLDYPNLEDEIDIALTTTGQAEDPSSCLFSTSAQIQGDAAGGPSCPCRPARSRRTPSAWCGAPRSPKDEANPDFIKHYLTWGAGPQACQALILGSKGQSALLDGSQPMFPSRTSASSPSPCMRFIAW